MLNNYCQKLQALYHSMYTHICGNTLYVRRSLQGKLIRHTISWWRVEVYTISHSLLLLISKQQQQRMQCLKWRVYSLWSWNSDVCNIFFKQKSRKRIWPPPLPLPRELYEMLKEKRNERCEVYAQLRQILI